MAPTRPWVSSGQWKLSYIARVFSSSVTSPGAAQRWLLAGKRGYSQGVNTSREHSNNTAKRPKGAAIGWNQCWNSNCSRPVTSLNEKLLAKHRSERVFAVNLVQRPGVPAGKVSVALGRHFYACVYIYREEGFLSSERFAHSGVRTAAIRHHFLTLFATSC